MHAVPLRCWVGCLQSVLYNDNYIDVSILPTRPFDSPQDTSSDTLYFTPGGVVCLYLSLSLLSFDPCDAPYYEILKRKTITKLSNVEQMTNSAVFTISVANILNFVSYLITFEENNRKVVLVCKQYWLLPSLFVGSSISLFLSF